MLPITIHSGFRISINIASPCPRYSAEIKASSATFSSDAPADKIKISPSNFLTGLESKVIISAFSLKIRLLKKIGRE
jgi:hypothetical protein